MVWEHKQTCNTLNIDASHGLHVWTEVSVDQCRAMDHTIDAIHGFDHCPLVSDVGSYYLHRFRCLMFYTTESNEWQTDIGGTTHANCSDMTSGPCIWSLWRCHPSLGAVWRCVVRDSHWHRSLTPLAILLTFQTFGLRICWQNSILLSKLVSLMDVSLEWLQTFL